MALADLTLLTIMFEFLPPLIVTLAYLIFFGNRKSRLIEAFIVLMYLRTVTWFLFNIALSGAGVGAFDPVVDTRILSWLLLTDLLFQFTSGLQEYLIWVMVSFFAVLFGMLVLAAKLTLQDPLKIRFKNLIRRITKREPETDGYTGLRDRLDNITFEGVEPQPLNPEVQARAWRDSWRDYVIIGLATLVPSISVYIGGLPNYILLQTETGGSLPDNYILNVFIFVTWIYRFGYPASNRIAKGAGLQLGDRDLGGEMMRGVLGWFFRLNILLTVGILGYDVWLSMGLVERGIVTVDITPLIIQYYLTGLALAAPPIIFVILIFPLVEDFSVVLYKRTFDSITQARSKLSTFNWGRAFRNFGVSVGAGLVVTGAYVASVFATTLNYSIEHLFFAIFPGAVDDEFIGDILFTPPNNLEILGETIWVFILLAIPFAMMIVLGILGYYIRRRLNIGIESFALFSGATLAFATYFILPGLDYIVGTAITPANYAGEVFNRMRPFLVLPTEEQFMYRLASQFIVNLPIFVFSTLFIMYFFEFRESWRETIGETIGPLLKVEKRDLAQSTVMFFGGLMIAIFGIWGISTFFNDPFYFRDLLIGLLEKIANPDGLEGVLPPPTDFLAPRWLDPTADPLGWFIVFAEHNLVRTLLMMVMGPIFWSAVLWYFGARKSLSEKFVGPWSIVVVVIGGAITFLWTQYDYSRGLINPFDPRWGYAAGLGLRAFYVFGAMLLLVGVIALVNSRGGRGIGSWWFPLFLIIFVAEYFIYDDQFTVIALIVLPFFLAGGYRLFYRDRTRDEKFLITYIKFGIMSIAIAEVLSTALTLGGIAIIEYSWGVGVMEFISRIIPHAIVEIPTFLVAAAASFRIAKDLWPAIEEEDWESVPSKTRALLGDERTWRTYILIMFFLVIAALIEAFVTPIVFWLVMGL
ncbi:MAG: stage II sporulation protein M [Candidatus Thorarchaeota archaeon]